MNVNLWGPAVWQVLHGIASLAQDPRVHASAADVLGGLRMLLPCVHCLNSYREFFATAERAHGPAHTWFERGEAMQRVYDLHCAVDDKLERQRVDKLLAEIRPELDVGDWPAVESAIRASARVLSSRPSFAVVLKRWALSEGKPFPSSAVWVGLLAFALMIDREPSEILREERRVALAGWARDVAAVLRYTLEYGDLARRLTLLHDAAMSARGAGSRDVFALVACAREGILDPYATWSTPESLLALRMGEQAWLRPLWRLYKENMPAGACGSLTCA
jgi:hypothetical protein